VSNNRTGVSGRRTPILQGGGGGGPNNPCERNGPLDFFASPQRDALWAGGCGASFDALHVRWEVPACY